MNYAKQGASYNPNAVSGPCDTSCDSAPINSRIRDGVSYVETQVMELHHAISALEERLDTILVPVPPNVTSTGVGKDSNGPVSHMFDRMSGLNLQVSEAKSRLHAIMSRIEL